MTSRPKGEGDIKDFVTMVLKYLSLFTKKPDDRGRGVSKIIKNSVTSFKDDH